ncbi:DUF2079 domain-containing protein [Edaphocola aurantiacus]|uniref:DUF2079 domain-containing protein n=1 Tax=Edaphocola aurantiacus TaxID=2601682 RepID=UPI001C93C8F0|nr:DUF2079 domain-containing protein [Edaphocola aurantiacus]
MPLTTPDALKQRKQLLLVMLVFFIIYGLISFVNHYNFRTAALDLGMFNQALYAYSHGHSALYTLDPGGETFPFLSTHFSPITLLYIPVYCLAGSYSFLLIQIISVLSGAYGIYKVALHLSGSRHKVSMLILLQFLITWGIFSALAFDFHNNVVGAMFVPWIIYYFLQGKTVRLLLVSILFLMTQETMALWYPFIITGLLLNFRSSWTRRQLIRIYIPMNLGSIIYALFIILYVMPSLQGHEHNLQFSRYTHLGSTAAEIVRNLLTHPVQSIKLLFTNPLGDPLYDNIKTEFYLALLLSGGVFILLRPAFLIMLIPVIAQKMLSNNFAFWGTNLQYSIEYIPVLCAATISFFSSKKDRKPTILYLSLILTAGTTVRLLDSRISKWYFPELVRIYQPAHYRPYVNNQEVYQALSLIPADVPASSSTSLAPHIANRLKLYHFPVVNDAAYMALLKHEHDAWPMKDASAYLELIETCKKDPGWIIVRETKDIVILKRSTSQ